MHCPICCQSLLEVDYEGAVIRTCDACGGEFLTADALRRIVCRREMRFPDDLRRELAGREPIPGIPMSEFARALNCPGCSGAMHIVNYAGDTGVFIDRCDECESIWLDRKELEHVQVLIEGWEDTAPARIRAIAGELEESRRDSAEGLNRAFAGSRFSFVNALINRVLDAA